MRTRLIPKPTRQPSVLVEQGLPIWIEHADRFWQAEVVNSQRYTSWARFMIGLQLTTTAAFLSGLSYVWIAPSRFGFLTEPIESISWGIAALAFIFLWRVPQHRGLRFVGLLLSGALGIALLLILAQAFGSDGRYLSHVLAGLSVGTVMMAVTMLVYATNLLLQPPRSENEPVVHTASGFLRLSQAALQRARSELTGEQWSSFHRMYRAAVDLQRTNAQFRMTIMHSQRLAVIAIAIIVPAVILTLLAFALSP